MLVELLSHIAAEVIGEMIHGAFSWVSEKFGISTEPLISGNSQSYIP